mmetsp:Transcript_19446/g.65616  ORF Transcript_19446/g.65616 Transcript_19446/m.65616 type:complete len:393 (-) Transcript_19446:77-1255(-)
MAPVPDEYLHEGEGGALFVKFKVSNRTLVPLVRREGVARLARLALTSSGASSSLQYTGAPSLATAMREATEEPLRQGQQPQGQPPPGPGGQPGGQPGAQPGGQPPSLPAQQPPPQSAERPQPQQPEAGGPSQQPLQMAQAQAQPPPAAQSAPPQQLHPGLAQDRPAQPQSSRPPRPQLPTPAPLQLSPQQPALVPLPQQQLLPLGAPYPTAAAEAGVVAQEGAARAFPHYGQPPRAHALPVARHPAWQTAHPQVVQQMMPSAMPPGMLPMQLLVAQQLGMPGMAQQHVFVPPGMLPPQQLQPVVLPAQQTPTGMQAVAGGIAQQPPEQPPQPYTGASYIGMLHEAPVSASEETWTVITGLLRLRDTSDGRTCEELRDTGQVEVQPCRRRRAY